MVSKPVVIGIDLGASESYVAFVGKGNVDIVQNEASKRGQPSVVGFTDKERLLGEPGQAKIKSNAKNSCRNFKHLLGRKLGAPDLEAEHFWSTSPLCTCADGHAGYEVSYKGETRQMSAVEVTAMYLTKMKETTEAWCQGIVGQCVIAVPSSYSDVQRQAVMDAARVANIQVLRVMNEHTATALAYGIYRSNDFDKEKPMTVAFCSMGNSLFSVSIVRFVRGKLTVLCEKSAKVGGRDLDACLMREFAAQFKKKVGCDPLTSKKACLKLEDAVAKTKKVLSANREAPVSVECLMEDEDFASVIQRDDLEKMCEPAMEQTKAVLDAAVAGSGLKLEEIDSVEIVGGSSRVPWVKRLCSEAFGKELSTTMNQEESVARGCALMAAILSPLYKVRDFDVVDVTPFPVSIGWAGSDVIAESGNDEPVEAAVAAADAAEEGEFKSTVIFPAGSQMNVLKSMTFSRKGPFEIRAEYTDPSLLLPLTPKELGSWTVELPKQTEAKKVQVRSRLTLHGTFEIEGAELVEQEEYEEVTKEKREITEEPKKEPEKGKEGEKESGGGISGMFKSMFGGGSDKKTADGEATAGAVPADGDKEGKKEEKSDEKKGEKEDDKEKTTGKKDKKDEKQAEPEKKFEWVEVKKMKKRTKRTELKVSAVGRPGLSASVLQELTDAECAMQAEMRDIIETDQARNDVEAYIFNMRDKCSDSGIYKDFILPEVRDTFMEELTKAEDWLYDTFDATKAVLADKLMELRKTGDPVVFKHGEAGKREEWVQAVQGTIDNYRTAAATPGEKFGHIAAEKLAKVISQCDELQQWLNEMKEKQASTPLNQQPVLLCADMEKKNKDLAAAADAVLKEPKPAPPKPKEEPKEEPKKEEEAPPKEGEAAATPDTEAPAAEEAPKAEEGGEGQAAGEAPAQA